MTRQRTQPLILIADDDPTVRLWGESHLAASGFEVYSVADGQAALDAFRVQRPDLVLLDVEMPVLGGFSACRAIREQDAECRVPIVMLTGLNDAASVQEAYRSGATDFICKPVHWPTLPHRLHYILRASANLVALTESRRDIQALLSALPDRIIVVDARGHAREGFGAPQPDNKLVRVAMTLEQVLPGGLGRRVREYLPEVFATQLASVFECEAVADKKFFEVRMIPHGTGAIAIVRDITERREADARIHQLAFYDTLTGLPNRPNMVRHLASLLGSAKGSGRGVAALFIDLDHFKRINDTLGHTIGDRLLEQVAMRLETQLRSGDTLPRANPRNVDAMHLARLGGDEFVALIPDVDAEEEAIAIAKRVLTMLRAPFTLGTYTLVVTPSIGIAMYPQHGSDVETLLMNADAAMYRAKSAGRNRLCVYSGSMNVRSLERLDIESDLRLAISSGNLLLHYQPKVTVATGAVIGVEALLRWKHPERGWISPELFVSIAEESGLIVNLGEWVIQTVCRQLRAWHGGPFAHLHVAVNVSVRQFVQPGFARDLLRKVRDEHIQPNRLELEITESLFLQDVEANIGLLLTIKDGGLRVSLDDFGTGYSSLSYLRRLPIDFLARHGCDVVQGYLRGRPMAVEELERTLLAARGTPRDSRPHAARR